MSKIHPAMKLYICHDVMEIFQIEMEKFGKQKICLTPVWVEGTGLKVWAMSDARDSAEATVELISSKMSIWVPQGCLGELDGQVIVRGRQGFATAAMTDSQCSEITLF